MQYQLLARRWVMRLHGLKIHGNEQTSCEIGYNHDYMGEARQYVTER
ncbi:hypothetical protein OK016_09470 [Vibrio chagasii]|nr:hypothetical protein [Vibrio chagasii]